MQVAHLGSGMGLVKLGVVAIDGSRVGAASAHS